MTIGELYEEIKDILATEGIETFPSKPTVVRTLNRAKDDVVALLESVDPLCFITQKDYTIASGQKYIDLPGYRYEDDDHGYDSTDPNWRRIFGIAKFYADRYEAPAQIYDRRELALRDNAAGFWMYREANRLIFNLTSGSQEAFTLRLRYAPVVPDLAGTDTAAEYEYLPGEWLDLMTMRAALDLLPAKSAGRLKWKERSDERQVMLLRTETRKINTGPMRVQMTDFWEG